MAFVVKAPGRSLTPDTARRGQALDITLRCQGQAVAVRYTCDGRSLTVAVRSGWGTPARLRILNSQLWTRYCGSEHR